MLSRLEQDNLEALLTQLVGQGAAASPGTDDDDYRIVAKCVFDHSLHLGRLRTRRLRWIGQPFEIVEAMMQVAAHGIRCSLIVQRLEDRRITVERLQFD